MVLTTETDSDFRLDLSAASRAYLMEPHWNPSVEQQALARIYRMGQTRPVTTIRYVMKDSFEDVCGPLYHHCHAVTYANRSAARNKCPKPKAAIDGAAAGTRRAKERIC